MTGGKRVIGDKTMADLGKTHAEILGTSAEAPPLVQWASTMYTTYESGGHVGTLGTTPHHVRTTPTLLPPHVHAPRPHFVHPSSIPCPHTTSTPRSRPPELTIERHPSTGVSKVKYETMDAGPTVRTRGWSLGHQRMRAYYTHTHTRALLCRRLSTSLPSPPAIFF